MYFIPHPFPCSPLGGGIFVQTVGRLPSLSNRDTEYYANEFRQDTDLPASIFHPASKCGISFQQLLHFLMTRATLRGYQFVFNAPAKDLHHQAQLQCLTLPVVPLRLSLSLRRLHSVYGVHYFALLTLFRLTISQDPSSMNCTLIEFIFPLASTRHNRPFNVLRFELFDQA